MSKTRVIPTSEGRLIEVTEGVLREPPPEPTPEKPKKKHSKRYCVNGTKRSKRGRGVGRERKGNRHPGKILMDNIPGYLPWLIERQLQVALFRKQGHPGSVPGFRYEEALKLWAKARESAERDMTEIKKKINLSDAAEEALTEVITVMRGPQAPPLKLQAAKIVLEWTMAKPVAKSEVTVNSAEQWLESLIKDEPEG